MTCLILADNFKSWAAMALDDTILTLGSDQARTILRQSILNIEGQTEIF